jgi:predicted acyltransferase
MELVDTTATLDVVALPLQGAVAARPAIRAVRQRLVSLDAMRGFAVLGMIVVNTLAFSRDTYGFSPSVAFLAHSPWAGFTFADFVFPAFIFMAGFSVAVSLQRNTAVDAALVRRVATRSLLLFALGFLLTNIDWLGHPGHGAWRLMGVLQRIGICYFATALLFVSLRPRALGALAVFVLLLYWPLAIIPVAHQATNLLVPGANFVSWLDRSLLGPHMLFTGPHGYDPEGLLSTIPAAAQCMLGALAGRWLLKHRDEPSAPERLALVGIVCSILGFMWSPLFPFVKNIWTSSYVLFSTGLAVLLLSFAYWALDRKRFSSPAVSFLEAFGLNALLAYVLQGLAQLLPAANDMHALSTESHRIEASFLITDLPVVAFVLMLWIPLEFLRRRRWIVKL